jgi:hypothetical protein
MKRGVLCARDLTRGVVELISAALRARAGLHLLAVAALLFSSPAQSQSRISAGPDCSGNPVNPVHFDQTMFQADYKVMVSEYEVEPDIRIRLVDQPVLADLILADGLPGNDFAICRSSTRHQATTLFVARFVTQPDVTIMLSRKDRHADFTLYVESETVSDIEAAALFWLAWKQNSLKTLQ